MKTKKFKIRKAREKDLNIIYQMLKELASFHKLLKKFKTTKKNLKQNLLDPKGPDVLIAEENNKPVGIIIFYQIFSSFLGQAGIYIEDLYVQSEHRKKGYGRKLLSKVCQIANKKKCGTVEWKVFRPNKTAISFYKKMGAVPTEKWISFKLTEKAFKKLLN